MKHLKWVQHLKCHTRHSLQMNNDLWTRDNLENNVLYRDKTDHGMYV